MKREVEDGWYSRVQSIQISRRHLLKMAGATAGAVAASPYLTGCQMFGKKEESRVEARRAVRTGSPARRAAWSNSR